MARKRTILFYNEKVTYIFSTCLLALLLATLFLPTDDGRIVGSVLALAAAVIASIFIKKRQTLSINAKMVLLIMSIMGLLYITLYYITGIVYGLYHALVRFSVSTFFKYVLPIAIIIVASEVIRSVLLAQNSKVISVLSYLICFFLEILVSMNAKNIDTFNEFADVLGYTVLPAVTANILYHFVSKRYGKYPNISYRLITSLFPYIIPYTSQLSAALYAFARLAVPLLIYFFIGLLYEKRRSSSVGRKSRWLVAISSVFSLIFMVAFMMLISCQFKHGLIVIATESMTGDINKGDAILYTAYDDEKIEVGQVIVFRKTKNTTVVHRVVDIEIIDGVARYYTKGDANLDEDPGYVTRSQIIGITNYKIPYIGMPTLWFGELFSE